MLGTFQLALFKLHCFTYAVVLELSSLRSLTYTVHPALFSLPLFDLHSSPYTGNFTLCGL